MPCRDGRDTPEGRLQQRVDELARENDTLRELVADAVDRDLYRVEDGHGDEPFGAGTDGPWIGFGLWNRISADQVEHRAADLRRCETALRTALAQIDPLNNRHDIRIKLGTGLYSRSELHRMLGAVITANATAPLRQQLGFNPDSI